MTSSSLRQTSALEQMIELVRQMHTTSGLLGQLAHGVTLDEAQAQVLGYVREWVPEAKRAPLAGTRSGRTAASSRGTCPSWRPTCTTA